MENVFEQQLIKLRRKKRLSQSGLANKLYVSRQAVSKWENGDAEPNIDKLISLSEIFNVSLDGLILGKNNNHNSILDVNNLVKVFNNNTVLNGINLKINGDERIALLGNNGAGKTTLIKCITGLTPLTSGELSYHFQPKKGLSLMPQSDILINDLKVCELISLTESIYKMYSKSFTNDLLKKFKLEDISYRYVSQLSGGQKRRLSLLLSLIRPSQLLILDEPTVGMDLKSIDFLWHYLDHVMGSIIMITHDFNQIDKFFSRVILLKDGKISQDISIDTIHSHNQTVEQWYRINNGGVKQ